MEAAVERRPRPTARLLASAAFVVLIVGITYFAILVYQVRYGDSAQRAAAFVELGDFLSGQASWYQDARTYGLGALLLALVSLLFGVHAMARITLPLAGAILAFLHFYGDQIRDLLTRWAQSGG